ncbi:MAG: prepilin-type N-terminal cleavage/methylation domain-containing protein [Bdellovibrionales bacterium]|nr:prepilin-type N-terminal cleavage/methylation domain-containing protein [Bdellovibrionales bacterium]
MNQELTKKNLKKGFSLIELLVVVAITGVLAAVAIPSYNVYRERSSQTLADQGVHNLMKAFELCLTDKTLDDCATKDIAGTISTPCFLSYSEADTASPKKGCFMKFKPLAGKVCYDYYINKSNKRKKSCFSYDDSKDNPINFKSGSACLGSGICN